MSWGAGEGESRVTPKMTGNGLPILSRLARYYHDGRVNLEQVFRSCSDFSGGYGLSSTLFETGRVHPDTIGDDVVQRIFSSTHPFHIIPDSDVKAAFAHIRYFTQPIVG